LTLAIPMTTQWFLTREGQARFGPYTEEQLREFAASGRILPTDLVWHEGMAQWATAGTVLGASLAPPLPSAPTAPPHVGQARSSDGNKIACGVVAILLGALGIHKFMLGITTPGLVMLLVTVLTCGYGGIVMGVIGLIEGIIYLTRSDEEFRQTYVVEKKAWF
jgi:TM2 domain-containing membrane protein YozV